MTIGLAIPSCKSYIQPLENLLENISKQTIIPDEISISISEVEEWYPQNDFGLNLIITPIREIRDGAENRNTAGLKLSTDLISFFDCDDFMHPQRTEFILESFIENNIVALVHEFDISENVPWKEKQWSPSDFMSHLYDKKDLELDIIKFINPNHLYPVNEQVNKNYHNAHVTVRKEIFEEIKYQEGKWGADSLFNREIVEKGLSISMLNNKLSYYNLR